MDQMSKTCYNQSYLKNINDDNNNNINNNYKKYTEKIQMNKTSYNQSYLNKDKGEWPGLIPCKFPTTKKIIERPNTTEDYYLSIII
jgi:hypothetical protein